MKIVMVEPKNIYITLEMSLEDADRLLGGLDLAKPVLMTGTGDPAKDEAIDTVKRFGNMLDEVVKDLKKDES